jgi:hypothetical protein
VKDVVSDSLAFLSLHGLSAMRPFRRYGAF